MGNLLCRFFAWMDKLAEESEIRKKSLPYLIKWCNTRANEIPNLLKFYPKYDDAEEYIARAFIFSTRTRHPPIDREVRIKGRRCAYLMARKLALEIDRETRNSPRYHEYGVDYEYAKVKDVEK